MWDGCILHAIAPGASNTRHFELPSTWFSFFTSVTLCVIWNMSIIAPQHNSSQAQRRGPRRKIMYLPTTAERSGAALVRPLLTAPLLHRRCCA